MKQILEAVNVGDIRFFYMVNNVFRCTLFNRIMPFITYLGGAIFTTILCILLIVIGKGNIRYAGLLSLISLAIDQIPVQIIKRKLVRPRPFLTLSNVSVFITRPKDYSFPSGHTSAACSLYLSLAFFFPQLLLLALPLSALVGISRVYLGVHYPTDVLAGAVLGILTSLLVHLSYNMLF
jgi:undecaprenyl-diphosphatase